MRYLASALCAGALFTVGCTPTEQVEDPPSSTMAPATPVASVVPTNGLVGEWKLDGNADDTKNGFDATLQGGATFIAGKIGSALNLDNDTDGVGGKHARMPSNGTLDVVQEGSYTISAWFFPYTRPPNTTNDNSHWSVVVKHGQTLGLVYNSVGRFVARHFVAGPTLVFAASEDTYAVNQWYHVASVVNRPQGLVQLYVNGELQGTDEFTDNAAAFDYGTRFFRIGQANNIWTADGKVDQVRIYDRALSGAEVGQLADESATPEDPTLRVGWMGMQEHIGEGPGGDEGSPYYRVVQWNPHAEPNLEAAIAEAEAKQIILLAYTPGGPNNFGGGTPGGFNLDAYEAQLDTLATSDAFNDGVAAGRIHCYIGDEPNRQEIWHGTWTPTLFNRAARENKERWPTCLTFGRLTPTLLTNGWDGHDGLSEYDALDYGWLQYAAVHRKAGLTIQQAINQEKELADSLDIGLMLSMNMMNAGLRTDLDGVTACWNSDNMPNTPTGIVIGSPAEGSFDVGDEIPCNQVSTVPTSQNLIVNPNWIRRIAEIASDDPDIPYLVYWNYPSGPAGSGPLGNFVFRPDFVSAFTDAIAFGASRNVFSGLRSPKP